MMSWLSQETHESASSSVPGKWGQSVVLGPLLGRLGEAGSLWLYLIPDWQSCPGGQLKPCLILWTLLIAGGSFLEFRPSHEAEGLAQKRGPELVSAAQRRLLWRTCRLPVGRLSTRRCDPTEEAVGAAQRA